MKQQFQTLFSLIFTLSLLALYFNQESIPDEVLKGKVEFLKGVATKLLPHSKKATELQLGDRILEDTSIVTQENTYLRLRFDDGSQMSIGPKSKILISKLPKKGTKIWNFFKGNFRSQMEKHPNSQKLIQKGEYSHLVKTKTAALGVRGTSFLSLYNPENEQSSVVTITGEVELRKNATEEATKVLPGEFAGFSPKDSSTKAVQKFPVVSEQMDLIASKDPGGIVEKNPPSYKVDTQTPVAVDFGSGLAINGKLAKFNKETGQYIPPKGLKIDIHQGLVLDEKEFKKLERKEQLAMTELLGENKKELQKANTLVKKQGRLPRRYELRAQYSAFASNMSFYSGNSSKEKYHSQIHHLMKFSLMPYQKNIKTTFQVDFLKSNVNFSSDSRFSIYQTAHDLYGVYGSLVYIANKEWRVYAGGNFDQRFWPISSASSSLTLKRLSRWGLHLVGQWDKNWSDKIGSILRWRGIYRFNSRNSQDFSGIFCGNLEIGPHFLLDKNLHLLALYNGILERAKNENHSIIQSQHGVGLELLVDF